MSLQKEFKRELERLSLRRTADVRKQVGISSFGPTPSFTRRMVGDHIENLKELTKQIMIKRCATREFNRVIKFTRRWHPKRGKGWGVDAKQSSFREWFENKVDWSHCIYVFWSKNRCEYVGKTHGGSGRPRNHFEKFWFNAVTQIDIYAVERESEVAKAECLAIDLWNPRRNDYAASRPKYSKRCPVCSVAMQVSDELKTIFRLR